MKFWFMALATVLVLIASRQAISEAVSSVAATADTEQGLATAIFAGGCFWCMEPPYDKLEGVIATTSGYAGGHLPSPTYRDVTSGTSGHLEVVEVTYDPAIVSYSELLQVFWRNVDPVDAGGQFCDRGQSYTTGIFVQNEFERKIAEASREEISVSLNKKVVTPILELNNTGFTPAETYHQDYYLKNPIRYKFYRSSCGRDRRLEMLWGS